MLYVLSLFCILLSLVLGGNNDKDEKLCNYVIYNPYNGTKDVDWAGPGTEEVAWAPGFCNYVAIEHKGVTVTRSWRFKCKKGVMTFSLFEEAYCEKKLGNSIELDSSVTAYTCDEKDCTVVKAKYEETKLDKCPDADDVYDEMYAKYYFPNTGCYADKAGGSIYSSGVAKDNDGTRIYEQFRSNSSNCESTLTNDANLIFDVEDKACADNGPLGIITGERAIKSYVKNGSIGLNVSVFALMITFASLFL